MTSERLGFGTWTPDDQPLADALWGDPQVTTYHGGQWTQEQINQRLRREIEQQQQHGIQYWPVFLKDTGEHVGCCGLQPRDAANGIVELGCHLRRAFWSHHLGREAAAAVIAYGFGTLGARAIMAGHHPNNSASRQFLEHLGFRYKHDEFYPPSQMMEPCYLLQG